MAVSRFFWKTAGGAFIARQRHTASHAATLLAAEHRYLHADFAVAGGNGADMAMVAALDQAALVAEGLVVIRGLLEGGLQLGGDLAFQLGCQMVQRSHSGASPVGGGSGIVPPFYNQTT